MGLRVKILSGFLILSVMLSVAGAWSIYELNAFGTSVQKLLSDNYKSINAAKKMIEALEREDSAVLLLVSGKWEQGREIMKSADSLFQQGFKIAQNNVTIVGEQAYVDEIESKYLTYKKLWEKPIVGTKKEGNLNWYFHKVHNAFQEVKVSVEKLMSLNDQTMYQTASNLKDRAHRATMPGVVAILSALIFTLIFNYFINYYVVSPIIKIAKGVREYTKTRKPLDIKIETEDELQVLVSSVQDLLTDLEICETKK